MTKDQAQRIIARTLVPTGCVLRFAKDGNRFVFEVSDLEGSIHVFTNNVALWRFFDRVRAGQGIAGYPKHYSK